MNLRSGAFKTESCNKMGKDYYDKRRGSSTQRGYGSRWQRARAAHLRAHPLCQWCERDGVIRAASVVHHSTPHKGDTQIFWDTSQWVSLCKPHHDIDAQREERGRAIQRIDVTGWPIE